MDAKDFERDKNWERVLRTAIGFGKKHGRWPTRLVVDPGILSALEQGFEQNDYRRFADGVQLVPSEGTLRAEADDGDTYNYGESLATRLTFTVRDPRPKWLTLDLAAPEPVSEGVTDPPALEALVGDWHTAIRTKDLTALDEIWAEDYTAVGPDGQLSSKAQELENVGSPDLVFDVLDVSDVDVMPLGGAAVVRSRTAAKGSFAGQPFDDLYQNTTVFVSRSGRWIVFATQSTPIAPPVRG